MVPGCDSDGPCLCIDLSDKIGLAKLKEIVAGNAPNEFPQFTVNELETLGLLRGNIYLIVTVIIIAVKISIIICVQNCWLSRFRSIWLVFN